MPRYAILEHDFPSLHWDLLLEFGPILRTWRLAKSPLDTQSIEAESAPDHRLLYLDYEGEISGGRGRVTRWDHGMFECLTDEADSLVCKCSGITLNGTIRLINVCKGQWHFLFDASK